MGCAGDVTRQMAKPCAVPQSMDMSVHPIQSFVGTIFGDAGLSAPCEVIVYPDHLEIRAHAAQWSSWFADLRLTLGGFDHDFVFIDAAGQSRVAVNDPNFLKLLRSLTQNPSMLEANRNAVIQALSLIDQHRSTHKKKSWVGVTFIVGIFVVIGLLIWNIPSMLALMVDWIPTSVDRTIGDTASGELGEFGQPVHRPEVEMFAQRVMQRLGSNARQDFEYRVQVLESDQVNAFALPGGQMVVLTGLLQRAESADEVAGVMAHEISHVTERHGLRSVARQLGITLLFAWFLGDAGAAAQLGGQIAASVRSNSYSRDQESDADARGLRLMRRAGFNGYGMSDFFRHMQQRGEGELPSGLAWLSTHPDHESRIRAIEGRLGGVQRGSSGVLATEFAAMQSALGGRKAD